MLPQRLVDAIQRNEFPMIDVKVSAEVETHSLKKVIRFAVDLENVGGAPAFGFRVYWDKTKDIPQNHEILAPGGRVSMGCMSELSGGVQHLNVEYESPIGVSVHDRFKISGKVLGSVTMGGTLVSGCERVEHRFRRSTGVQIEIDDQ